MAKHITSHSYQVSKEDRNSKNGHNSILIWFTGLSGSGKSTIANGVEKELFNRGISTYVLDGDNIRFGLNKDLSFSENDRRENIRRIAEVSKLMMDAGLVVLAAFVSPYKKDRQNISKIVKDINFVEVFVNAPIAECEKRDVKGLYKKARAGEIKNLTGIDAPYEAPEYPNIEIKTDQLTVVESIEKVLDMVLPKIVKRDE